MMIVTDGDGCDDDSDKMVMVVMMIVTDSPSPRVTCRSGPEVLSPKSLSYEYQRVPEGNQKRLLSTHLPTILGVPIVVHHPKIQHIRQY